MQTRVPFVDLARLHAPIKADVIARITSVIERSAFVLGPEVEAFENEFARFVGSKYSVGVSSGLDALKLALQALGIGPGDEVITAANTFIATAYAITLVGAKVVLVDCEPGSRNLDPKQLEKAITKKTKAILPVHLYGQPASMNEIREVARKHGLSVVEDAAQAHGATYEGIQCGNLGVMGCFSFYPGKNLGSMGEGGAITTSDESLRDRLRMLRNVGQKEKYHHELIGHNCRLHTMQATVLSAKLPGLVRENASRARAAFVYRERLAEVRQISLPSVAPGRESVHHLYAIALSDPAARAGLQKHLHEDGIQTGIHYPIPIHLSTCYANLGLRAGSFPVTERLADSLLSLPMFPGITDEEIGIVAGSIRSFFKC